jgi:hypothetical protein
MRATAVDHGLSFVTVKLQPYRQGTGREGSGEPNQPHLVFAKSHKRSSFPTNIVYRGVEKLYVGASKSLFDKITISLHNLSPLTRRSLGRKSVALGGRQSLAQEPNSTLRLMPSHGPCTPVRRSI